MKNRKRSTRVRIAKLLLPAILLACSGTVTTNAQDFVKTYYANGNMKQYTTLPVPDKPHYVMAGTFENQFVHFIYTDGDGNPLISRIYRESGAASEEHEVGMVAIDPETYMIVALRRDANIGSGSYDKIKVYTVDAGGGVLDVQTIRATLQGGTNYSNMYPTHCIYDNGILYICGFVSNQDINSPYTPNFRGSQTKKAFVLRYNTATTSATAKTYDYTYTITPSGNVEPFDYDVAMKMKLMSNGKLYVTGSCNVIQAASSTNPTYFFNGGTLNLELDATTLATQNGTTGSMTTSFTTDPYSPPYLYGEYGVDIIEDPNSGYYVVGNTGDFSKLSMNVDGHNLQFTYIDNNFKPQGIKSRMRLHSLDGGFGLTAMASENGTGHTLIGGMQTNKQPNCNFNVPPPSTDNFNPFLADVSLQWNSGSSTISGSINDWKVYLTHFSTGSISVMNSYYQYGGNVTYNGWNPVFASRRPSGNVLSDDDIIMSAPAWDQNRQLLSLKMLRTDPYGDIPECPDSYVQCPPDMEPVNVVHLSSYTGTVYSATIAMTEAAFGVTVAAAPSDPIDFGFDQVIDCEASGGNYYRTVPNNVVAVNAQNIEATLLPNPASDFVQVSIKGNTDVDAVVKVELTDITGKLLKTLYNGKARSLTDLSHLTLPSVASGMYLVKISVGNQLMPIQKLVINSSK